MQVYESVNNNKNLSIALGFFDGVHLAHQKLISNTVTLAKENGIKSAVITFSKSPASYFSCSDFKYITSKEEKIALLNSLGVDYAYMLDFKSIKSLSAEEYLQNILIKNFNPRFITTGFNHTFGIHKSGCPHFLRENQGSYKYIELDKIRVNNTLVSSTNIKRFLQKGYIKEANMLLGRKFEIKNTVIKGNRLGRTMGFKTANLLWPDDIVRIPYGVYCANVMVDGDIYNAMVNFGVKPTISNENSEVLEAHILDFDKNIYGKSVKVSFKNKIRDEIKFSGIEELKKQIASDIKNCLDCN